MNPNDSIISIASDSTQEMESDILSDTFSPLAGRNAMNTPKQAEVTLNRTFTPEDDSKKLPTEDAQSKITVLDGTFSPDKGDAVAAIDTTFSPKPKPEDVQIPQIIVQPPSVESKRSRVRFETPVKSEKLSMTPKSSTKTFRKTPLKAVKEIQVESEMKPPQKLASPSMRLLKSIRKRSFSVTDVDPPILKRNNRVQFHSPANMEKTIAEIDESLHLNFSKTLQSTKTDATVGPVRRTQRSMSNAETPLDKKATMEILEAKKKMPTPSPRRKMPNFAAIHNSIFSNMENLIDFNERKKERAQFLLNSADKKSSTVGNILKPANRGGVSKLPKMNAKKPDPMRAIKGRGGIGRKVAPIKMSDHKLKAILSETLAEENVSKSLVTVDRAASFACVSATTATFNDSKPINAPTARASYSLRNRIVPVKEVRPVIRSAPAEPNKTRDEPPPNKKMTSKAAPHTMIRGVRMNRHFDLLMKHRNAKKN